MTSTIISATVTDQVGADGVPIMTGSRPLGAAVAAGIAVIAAFLGFAIGNTEFLGLGIPAAAISAWLLSPSIRSQGGIAGPAVGMAVSSIAIADAWLVLGSVSSSASGSEAIVGAFGLWAIGLLVVGIPMLIVTAPCGIAWAVIVRRLARDGVGRPLTDQQGAA